MKNVQQKARIAVDLDEVLNEFLPEFLKWYNLLNNTNLSAKDVFDYDWAKFMNISVDSAIKYVHEYFKTDEFKNLPVADGAIATIQELAGKYDLYLITARQDILRDLTLYWLDKNFPKVFKQIIFVNHYSLDNSPKREKGEVCEELGCKVIIDDNPYHIQSLIKYRIKVILLDKPWNISQNFPKSVIRVDNIKEVPGIIEQLAL